MENYKRNHYVPEWYQHRFFGGWEKEKKFFYLDLAPEFCIWPDGKKRQRNELLRWGPTNCFNEENLYTTRFRGWESTEIEEKFFGEIDSNGKKAVEYFANFEHPSADSDSFHEFLRFMSIQKLRTPKGLGGLSTLLKLGDKNSLLFKMQEIQNMHCALWTECVWSIVSAEESNTKFILSDHPVTVYNQACFPQSRWCRKSQDPGIWLNGTHTIFPLSIDKTLLLTNLSWVRNPYGNPAKSRPHPELFRTAMFNFNNIQTGRVLGEQEVLAINYIIKMRAKRYIAASKKEWLYPEQKLVQKRWDRIGSSHILMPDPRSLTFSSEIIIGYDNKRADAFDEYGRKPWHDDYKDRCRHDYEWNTFHAFQGEYARLFGPKRKGVDYDFGARNKSVDSEDYHAYHLSLEQKYKPVVKKSVYKK